MNTQTKTENRYGRLFWQVNLALVAGLILSIFSWLQLCSKRCAASHEYLLFGLPMAPIGMVLFIILIILHGLSIRHPFLSNIVSWGIASSIGAELMFIAVQKYEIKQWCPVCLSIATVVFIAGAVLSIEYFKNLYASIHSNNKGEIMVKVKQALLSISFAVIGFLMAYAGLFNPNSADAVMNDMKDRLAFGKKDSNVVVYFFTDWYCPSCKKIEPMIEKIYPKIKQKTAFYFIDYPIHKKSFNYVPYNLAFLLNNKQNYFKARQALMDLADETETPKDEDIINLSKQNGLTFTELSFVDVKNGMEFFDNLVKKYDLKYTPTIVVANLKNNKSTKFEGADEISEDKVLKAIDKLKK